MTHICPSCGYNIAQDRIVEIGPWRLDPRGTVHYRGRLVTTRIPWTNILHTLASENGRKVSTEVLLARTSSSENNNTVASTVCQLRRHLRLMDIEPPIGSKRGSGAGFYYWIGEES